MLKSATIYQLNAPLDPDWANERMQALQFRAPGGLEIQSVGFVPFADGFELLHPVGKFRLGAVRIDKKQLPASGVNQLVKERCLELEEQQGFKPGRRQTREIKEQVIDELLPRAICASKQIRFMATDDLFLVEATSAPSCDLVIGLLAKAWDPFPLTNLSCHTSPAGAMTTWVVNDDLPEGLSADDEAEMRSSTKASVRWKNSSVDPAEAANHFRSGKSCIKMALTWNDRVSFMLNDQMVLSKIKYLDLIEKDDGAADDELGVLESDVVLKGGELECVINGLINAFGGRREG